MGIKGLLKKKDNKVKIKKQYVKYTIDCTQPVDENLIDCTGMKKYFMDRIKLDGKTGNLGKRVEIETDRTKISVTAELPFKKQQLRYLSKKYLKKQELRDYVRVISNHSPKPSKPSGYQLK